MAFNKDNKNRMDNIGSVMKNRSSISTGVSKIYLRDSVFGQNEPRYE